MQREAAAGAAVTAAASSSTSAAEMMAAVSAAAASATKEAVKYGEAAEAEAAHLNEAVAKTVTVTKIPTAGHTLKVCLLLLKNNN